MADMISPGSRPRPAGRRWLFRLAGIGLGLAPVFLLEGLCVLLGWGTPDPARDPFVGFESPRPLFEFDPENRSYVIAPARRSFFAFDQFPADKPANGYRIFCLGGSTVQGNPYSIETSFTTWLELALRQIDPSRDWDVVNCGGVSYASYRLVPILQECLNHEPDLFILCSGHNEFLEDRTYGHLQSLPGWSRPLISWMAGRRVVTATREFLQGLGMLSAASARQDVLPPETDAMLDYRNGLAAYRRDPDWADGVHRHYEANLRRMALLARQANVPLLLVRPPSNLAEQPPFKSEHDAVLPPARLDQITSLLAEARNLFDTDVPGAVELLRQACELDPLQALTWFELGHCLETLGDYGSARAAYIQARDQDICPLRMTTPLEAALRRVAEEAEVPLLDAHELLESRTPHGILGGYWLVDHVHPSFEGHQQIALSLVRLLAELERVPLKGDWESACHARFGEHFASLDRRYFHRGQRMLRTLERWTQGNPNGTPAEVRFPHRIPREATARVQE